MSIGVASFPGHRANRTSAFACRRILRRRAASGYGRSPFAICQANLRRATSASTSSGPASSSPSPQSSHCSRGHGACLRRRRKRSPTIASWKSIGSMTLLSRVSVLRAQSSVRSSEVDRHGTHRSMNSPASLRARNRAGGERFTSSATATSSSMTTSPARKPSGNSTRRCSTSRSVALRRSLTKSSNAS